MVEYLGTFFNIISLFNRKFNHARVDDRQTKGKADLSSLLSGRRPPERLRLALC